MSSVTRTELPLLGGLVMAVMEEVSECWAGLELGSWILECVM